MGALGDLWLRWKMLRLPWRKQFLVGRDLSGNTFWEFKDAINHNRWRRIVKAGRHTHHSDIQIPPQWHQWLRQTRVEPPTLQELAADVQRQAALKHNARLADERWAAKAHSVEPPKPAPTLKAPGDSELLSSRPPQSENIKGDASQPAPFNSQNPWKNANDTGANPGAAWTPESWVPGASRR